ncbi:hypothetical protein [Spirosoma montaniterrae]|uniref:DUF4595 domain-containing protein n=1 Tax=Spirosoma montaniterrae TaxID=1178516 RepID=A0A1P9X2U3_9BACT|nr:hypothetical protein [Spirosoma montaniterrae]AQG81918.1 hypothetical protein AWR27_23050 [Spirosoma montaniterrae]
MKMILSFYLLLLFAGADIGCTNATSNVQPQIAGCRKIVVSEDGDETEYEFDEQGRLSSYLGESLADYYKNNFSFKRQWSYEGSTITLSRSNESWAYDMLDGSKNGFEQTFFPTDNGKGQKIDSWTSLGFEDGQVVTSTHEDYTYNANGDCVQLTNGNVTIDGVTTAKYTADFKYFADKPAPFAGKPFQWLIESAWSAGGHTNSHLTESEKLTFERIDDPDIKAVMNRTVIYSYQYDGKGRVSRIQIDTEEKNTVTHLDDGRTFTNTEKKQKVVTFTYDC